MAIPAEITELIQSSGNNFHAKVARWFVANDWHVVVSPYYMDQTQNKAREIDLVAEKFWPIYDRYKQPAGNVAIRLFVECKFVATHSVFWFADKNLDAASELVCASGLFHPENAFTKKHHYLSRSPRVAKLFASVNSKAAENELFYKALNQVLNAMVSMRDQPVSISSTRGNGTYQKALIEFPVVVCSSFDKVFSVDFNSESEPQPVQDNFQLEVRYAYHDRSENQRDDYFLLDFVAFDKLEAFAGAINEDAKSAVFFASEN